MRSFANGNGPTGGNSGAPCACPAIPVVDDGSPLFDPAHWWRLA